MSEHSVNYSETKAVLHMHLSSARELLKRANRDQKERRMRKIEARSMTKAMRASAAKTEK